MKYNKLNDKKTILFKKRNHFCQFNLTFCHSSLLKVIFSARNFTEPTNYDKFKNTFYEEQS